MRSPVPRGMTRWPSAERSLWPSLERYAISVCLLGLFDLYALVPLMPRGEAVVPLGGYASCAIDGLHDPSKAVP